MHKNALGEAKNSTAGLKSVSGWAKMGPPGAIFAHFEGTFGHLGPSFAHFYAFLSGFREQLCILIEIS